jgi:Ca-activated chloride channel family protein
VVVVNNDHQKDQRQQQQQQQQQQQSGRVQASNNNPPRPPGGQQQQRNSYSGQRQQPQQQQQRSNQQQSRNNQQQQKQQQKQQQEQKKDPQKEQEEKLAQQKTCYQNCIGTDRNCGYGTSTKCEPTPFTRENRHLTVDRAMQMFSSCAGERDWQNNCLQRIFSIIPKGWVHEAARWVDDVGRRQRKLPDGAGMRAMCPTPPGFSLNAESVRQITFWCSNTKKDCPGALAEGRNVLAAAQDVEECLWSAEFHVNRQQMQSKRHEQCKAQCGWGEDSESPDDFTSPVGDSLTPVTAPGVPEEAPEQPKQQPTKQKQRGGWQSID